LHFKLESAHPFPKRPTPKRSKPKPAQEGPAGPAFCLQDLDGAEVDVLMAVIQAGGMYLTPSGEHPHDDLPTTQLWRTIDGFEALDDAASILIHYRKRHPEQFSQDDTDHLIHQRNQACKVIRKLHTMVPPDDLIMTTDSYGPDLMAEYAMNAAIIVTTSFAMGILACYYEPFIRTGKDRRKRMFRDFQAAYMDVRDECLSRMEGHEHLIKELSSAHRAMQKALKDL
jgi:hypothetical protein